MKYIFSLKMFERDINRYLKNDLVEIEIDSSPRGQSLEQNRKTYTS